ncbi:MAG TPA: SGNH/GDSL hydrolase family protein [Melioribacteraceae bacterium]|nr:SGNH/GDSL hydrolase family protein [Melioribacteraceae bacterium]
MNTPLRKIIVILLSTLFIFNFYALYNEDISISIKRNEAPDFIDKKITANLFNSEENFVEDDSLNNVNNEEEFDSTSVADTGKVKILMIGDSMLHGLAIRFNDYCLEQGYDFSGVIWYSSSTKYWAQKDTLKHYIKRFKPNYLIFVIGGNELFVRDLNDRAEYIRNIEKQIGKLKSIWVGPPNWKKDTGINDSIVKIVGKERFFASKNLTFDRLSDGAHPTIKSAAKWMDSIAVFIEKKSKYPLKLTLPIKKSNKNPNLVLLKPPK